uniref:Uncharacterized protein n=1 Tax=Picea glauca TaxID=3330 RepID=A0A101LYR9_PICGL|nr:hypothetical protein ABT39_MTgene4811 [Picea glauca]QHR87434.1 hypothetical protein Q903MT_gene1444 [Picea sitchensis]
MQEDSVFPVAKIGYQLAGQEESLWRGQEREESLFCFPVFMPERSHIHYWIGSQLCFVKEGGLTGWVCNQSCRKRDKERSFLYGQGVRGVFRGFFPLRDPLRI